MRLAILTISTGLVVCMSRKNMACSGYGWWAWPRWATNRCYLWCLWTGPNDSKRIQASFLPIFTDWLRLQVAQTPRFWDLEIFVVTTTDRQTNRQTDYFTSACAWAPGNKYQLLLRQVYMYIASVFKFWRPHWSTYYSIPVSGGICVYVHVCTHTHTSYWKLTVYLEYFEGKGSHLQSGTLPKAQLQTKDSKCCNKLSLFSAKIQTFFQSGSSFDL